MKPQEAIEQLFTLMKRSQSMNYIGENVSQLEHALQCAKIAQDAHASEEEIVAALLHDIDHICQDDPVKTMGEYGVANHENVGADFLRSLGLSRVVCELVSGHVQAKRYLVSTNPKYQAQLSGASMETLRHQGGPMSTQEIEAFTKDPLFKQKLRIRSWDEQGKKPGWEVPELETYRAMITKQFRD